VNKAKLAGLMLVCVSLFLVLAILDYTLMGPPFLCAQNPNWNADLMYKYWIALGIVVFFVAFAVSYMAWLGGMSKQVSIAIFATIILLFVAGLLDIFFFLFTVIKNQEYSFKIWSAQYKILVLSGILPEWNWTCQIIWSSFCFAIIGVVWYYTLKKHK